MAAQVSIVKEKSFRLGNGFNAEFVVVVGGQRFEGVAFDTSKERAEKKVRDRVGQKIRASQSQ